MPYLHKQKFGSIESLGKRSIIIDPHMYSAPVGTMRVPTRPFNDGFGPDEEGAVVFWRSKTRTSSYAEWMELHDASDGATLWRAESRYSDRAAPIPTYDAKTGKETTEYLTVIRLYLENETRPRLMIVHRDKKPAGLRTDKANRNLAVYTLDTEGQGTKSSATSVGTGTAETGSGRASAAEASRGGSSRRINAAAAPPPPTRSIALPPTLEEPADQFDFADLPEGGDIFQLSLNNTLTNLSLTAVKLPDANSFGGDVRTLARMKRPADHSQRWVDIDGGLDVPLVTMLLCVVDQLLLSHDAMDYDVAWPSDYAFAHGECCSGRKPEAQLLKDLSDNGMQTEDSEPWAYERPSRMCFGLF